MLITTLYSLSMSHQPAADPELEAVRKHILSLLPEMATQIDGMTKEDLLEVLELAKQDAPHPASQQSIEYMIEKIVETFPDMKEEVKALDYADIKEIYEQMKVKDDAEIMDPPKVKQVQNGEPVVYEIKKTLIDRLPQYRSEIRNLSDEQIRAMFQQLQNDQKDRRPRQFEEAEEVLNEQQSQLPSSRKRGRPKKYRDPFEDCSGKSEIHFDMPDKVYGLQDYNSPDFGNPTKIFRKDDFASNMEQSELQFDLNNVSPIKANHQSISVYDRIKPNKAISLPQNPKVSASQAPKESKKQAKREKRRVKITFYLDNSDLEEQDGKGKSSLMSAMCEALGRVKDASKVQVEEGD